MAQQSKKDYVAHIVSQLRENPHLVVVGFTGTTHQSLEDLRGKLRELGDNAPSFMVLKNSLFKIAFNTHNRNNQLVSDDESKNVQNQVKGQAALMLMNEDWLSAIKVIKDFAKEQEGFEFKVGLIDGKVYEETGLTQLANLPGREELATKIIGALRAPQSRVVYGLNFNSMKLINVLKNASEVKN